MVEELLECAQPRRFKRAEYHRLVESGVIDDEERIELLHGVVVAMCPVGKPHNYAIQELTEALVLALHGRAKVRPQLSFGAADDSEPQPDIAVVPRGRYDREHPSEAVLIIEVAESSLRLDGKIKGPLYAAAGVPEYWIVNLKSRAVEVHTRPSDGSTRSCGSSATGKSSI